MCGRRSKDIISKINLVETIIYLVTLIEYCLKGGFVVVDAVVEIAAYEERALDTLLREGISNSSLGDFVSIYHAEASGILHTRGFGQFGFGTSVRTAKVPYWVRHQM